MNYNNYLQSNKWKQKRKNKYRKTENKRCSICYSDQNLHVHHLRYKPNLDEVESYDLRILCNTCHETTHELINSGKIKFKKINHTYRFTVIRDAVTNHLGLSFSEKITKRQKIFNEIRKNYNCLSRKPFKISHPEIVQVLTKKIIDTGKSKSGAWNLAQLRLFGFTNFPKKGWQSMLIGQEWPREIISQFLFLKNKHLFSNNLPFMTNGNQNCIGP